MIKKLFITLVLFISFQAESQNTDEANIIEDNSISTQLYTKCFENLNHGAEIFEKYPALKSMKFCSIITCGYLLNYKEEDIQLAATARLQGIATQLFREGNPIKMVSGMESYIRVQKENENLQDDDHLVYISYGECTSPYYLKQAADIVNLQTALLLKQTSK